MLASFIQKTCFNYSCFSFQVLLIENLSCVVTCLVFFHLKAAKLTNTVNIIHCQVLQISQFSLKGKSLHTHWILQLICLAFRAEYEHRSRVIKQFVERQMLKFSQNIVIHFLSVKAYHQQIDHVKQFEYTWIDKYLLALLLLSWNCVPMRTNISKHIWPYKIMCTYRQNLTTRCIQYLLQCHKHSGFA